MSTFFRRLTYLAVPSIGMASFACRLQSSPIVRVNDSKASESLTNRVNESSKDSIKKPIINYQKIAADLIIPGKGDPIPNGVVIIKNNLIDYVGPDIETDIEYSSEFTVPIIMPGLWDAHVHFVGMKQTDKIQTLAITPAAISTVRCIESLQTAINYGITNVREVGGYGLYLKQLIGEGVIIGPNIYSAGKVLSMTGGHGDFHEFPLHFMCELTKGDHVGALVDGEVECLKQTRINIRNGADLIKICATGGVMSLNDSLDSRQFSDSEIQTIVDEANRNNMIVAAHCHGANGIDAALNNGVKTIEHGTFLNEKLAQKMKDKDAILVPTRWIVEHVRKEMDALNLPESVQRKAHIAIEHHANAMKIAIEYGIKIAMGTDMFFTDCWGQNAKELEYYVQSGMSELDAIQSGTANGPLTLGENRNIKSGQIKEGFHADIIALNENPLDDICVLQDEKNIVLVWKNGSLLKNICDSNTKL